MSNDIRLLMLGAMYENGGNTSHRFLDGHPQMFVYPFESQVGTRMVGDHLASMFPVKYRWPVFALDATPEQDYRAIIDEECKVRARTPDVSKFGDQPFDLDDDHRLRLYVKQVRQRGRSRAGNVAAFFEATFEAWKDFNRSGREEMYVGYSPVVVVDAAKIVEELPGAHVLHVVRNPWSAYADTRKRPVPLSLDHYLTAWCLNQYYATTCAAKYPGRVSVVRFEDIVADPVGVLAGVLAKIGVGPSEALARPTWNGRALEQVYPWGTDRTPTPEA